MNTAPSSLSYTLFGLTTAFLPPPWTTTDDRVRGGSSKSALTALPHNGALFSGHLDTSTLGGAGFASQFSPTGATSLDDQEGRVRNEYWDLSAYDGIELEIGKSDGKMYTFILKDEEQAEKREDGREKAGVSWEVEFCADDGENKDEKEGGIEGTKIWFPWSEFKATYRGKEKKDAGELKTGEIRKIGIMMRSYFDKQSGDFSLELKAITARKGTSQDQTSALPKTEMPRSKDVIEKNDQKDASTQTSGLPSWLSSTCTIS